MTDTERKPLTTDDSTRHNGVISRGTADAIYRSAMSLALFCARVKSATGAAPKKYHVDHAQRLGVISPKRFPNGDRKFSSRDVQAFCLYARTSARSLRAVIERRELESLAN